MHLLILAFFTNAFLSTIAKAEIYTLLPREALNTGEAKLGFTGSYFKTTQNFDDSGNTVLLPNGGSLTSIVGTGSFNYGLTDEFTFFSDFQFVSNTINAITVSKSGRALGDSDVGLRYSPGEFIKPLRLLIEGSVEFPLYSRLPPNEWATLNSSSAIPTGDGTTSLSYYNLLELPTSDNFYIGMGFGYTYRSSGFSDFLPYEFYFKYEKLKNIYIKAGIMGSLTLTHDNFTGLISSERANTVIGGSNLFNSTNPTYLKADAEAGIYLGSHFFVAAGLGFPFSGKNTAYGPLFLGSLGFDFGKTTYGSDYSHSNRGFQEYTFYATVTQADNDLKMALINKGYNDGVQMGDILDMFEPGPVNQNGQVICRTKVIEVGSVNSRIEVIEFFKEQRLQEGFVVRKPVR